MPSDSDRIASDMAAIRDTLAGIGLDDSAQGIAADRVRQALAQHGRDLDAIADAARAVAKAAADRETLVAQRDAEMPTDDQIRAAQEAVILASDGGSPDDLAAATDRLSNLLAEKKAAQDKFERGETKSADDLHSATTDLPEDPGSASPLAGLSPMSALMAALKALEPNAGAGAPAQGAPAGVPATLAGASAPDGQLADLLDSLQSDHDGHGSRALVDPNWQHGAGQTQLSADQSLQLPTLSNAQTGADVSGRPASPFVVAGPPSGQPSGAAGGAPMPPMVPPMTPMTGNAAASGKGKNDQKIIRQDPDFTGADIDQDVATSGVVGRGEGRREQMGGIRRS
jgi:hypothetical protein